MGEQTGPVQRPKRETIRGSCPVCADHGEHRLVLTIPSSVPPGEILRFASCRKCHCKFVVDYQPVAYEDSVASLAPLRFYVEQGAGIEFLSRPLFAAAQRNVRSYLDVGCGFGFGLDMAARMFGWRARGIDPGHLAAAGREILGVRIEGDMLTAKQPLADGPFDAITATEVLEHIAQPDDFLQAIRGNLSDTGILVLSTPNGGYLDDSPDGGMLIPILSPGYHAVLYGPEALAIVLRRNGFSNVRVTTDPTTLFAVASPSGVLLDPTPEPDAAQFRRYLADRFRAAPPGSPLHTGFGYRLLRKLTEAQAYEDALAVFAALREALQSSFAIDIGRPLLIADRCLDERVAFADVPSRYPFCLAGLLYSRGIIAVQHERNFTGASCYFLATHLAARMLLNSLNDIGMSDGDIADLAARTARSADGVP